MLGTSFLSAADDPRRCTRRFALVIDSPTVRGSIAFKGNRIDDLALTRYRESVDPISLAIVVLPPSGSPQPDTPNSARPTRM